VLSPDGKFLYIADSANNRLLAFDFEKNEIKLIAGGPGDKVSFLDYHDLRGKIAATPTQLPLQYPTGVAVSKDGEKVYVADEFGGLYAISRTSNDVEFVDELLRGPKEDGEGHEKYGLAVAPDGSSIYTTICDGIQLSDIVTPSNNVLSGRRKTRRSFGHNPFSLYRLEEVPLYNPRSINFAPDGSALVTDSGYKRVLLVGPSDDEFSRRLPSLLDIKTDAEKEQSLSSLRLFAAEGAIARTRVIDRSAAGLDLTDAELREFQLNKGPYARNDPKISPETTTPLPGELWSEIYGFVDTKDKFEPFIRLRARIAINIILRTPRVLCDKMVS
jgi:DNA-binding beta-propeller fold protein YncE